MSSRIYVIAQFKAKAGKEAELFEVLKALEPDSYREQGCIQYTLTRQIDHPCITERNEFSIVFNEIWQDAAAWQAHGNRAQIKQFFEEQVQNPEGLVDDVKVTAYTDEGENYDAPVYE